MSNEKEPPCGWEYCVSWKELEETKKKLAASDALVRELVKFIGKELDIVDSYYKYIHSKRKELVLKVENHLNPER